MIIKHNYKTYDYRGALTKNMIRKKKIVKKYDYES